MGMECHGNSQIAFDAFDAFELRKPLSRKEACAAELKLDLELRDFIHFVVQTVIITTVSFPVTTCQIAELTPHSLTDWTAC